jgi:hypothetical protein
MKLNRQQRCMKKNVQETKKYLMLNHLWYIQSVGLFQSRGVKTP